MHYTCSYNSFCLLLQSLEFDCEIRYFVSEILVVELNNCTSDLILAHYTCSYNRFRLLLQSPMIEKNRYLVSETCPVLVLERTIAQVTVSWCITLAHTIFSVCSFNPQSLHFYCEDKFNGLMKIAWSRTVFAPFFKLTFFHLNLINLCRRVKPLHTQMHLGELHIIVQAFRFLLHKTLLSLAKTTFGAAICGISIVEGNGCRRRCSSLRCT